MKVLMVGIIILLAVVFAPFLTIWALNTLFPALAIPYALETWAAVILLGGVFRSNVTVKGK